MSRDLIVSGTPFAGAASATAIKKAMVKTINTGGELFFGTPGGPGENGLGDRGRDGGAAAGVGLGNGFSPFTKYSFGNGVTDAGAAVGGAGRSGRRSGAGGSRGAKRGGPKGGQAKKRNVQLEMMKELDRTRRRVWSDVSKKVTTCG